MSFKQLFSLLVLGVVSLGAQAGESSVVAVDTVLDAFHAAAANGDKERYLGLMTENAVFLGTDEWERWPKRPEFMAYVDSRFKDGTGWTYRSVDRHVEFSEAGDVAWFDEVVFSESSGRLRGTGVLVLQNGDWKIAHYALSFLVFNEDWDEVIELTRKTREAKRK